MRRCRSQVSAFKRGNPRCAVERFQSPSQTSHRATSSVMTPSDMPNGFWQWMQMATGVDLNPKSGFASRCRLSSCHLLTSSGVNGIMFSEFGVYEAVPNGALMPHHIIRPLGLAIAAGCHDHRLRSDRRRHGSFRALAARIPDRSRTPPPPICARNRACG